MDKEVLKNLYAAKGELVTQFEIVQNQLNMVNKRINEALYPQAVQAQKEEKKEEPKVQ